VGSGVFVRNLSVRDFRNHERIEVELQSGVTVFEGPVGSGKTNLLEALYVACLGRSFRTSNDRELIRFDAPVARVTVVVVDGGLEHRLEVVIQRSSAKVIRVDGARLERPAEPDARPLVCVFAPDRLELVKGAAGVRRAHLDEVVAALWPARRRTRRSYTRALAQRNSLLARVRAGNASLSSLGGWTTELAQHGVQLMADRRQAVELLSPRFAELGLELGLEGFPALVYRPRSAATASEELEHELEWKLESDLDRGFTTHGPHRDDLSLDLDGRSLRRFGSQGQQRLGLLALLIAERDVLASTRTATPLLLLDDVLSELDGRRRERLLDLLDREGQTLLTTADPVAVGSKAGFARVQVTGDGPRSTRPAQEEGAMTRAELQAKVQPKAGSKAAAA
jgi:DNA replication and repair protein RecF